MAAAAATAGDVELLTGLGEDMDDTLSVSRFVTVGDAPTGGGCTVIFFALAERNRPLYDLLW